MDYKSTVNEDFVESSANNEPFGDTNYDEAYANTYFETVFSKENSTVATLINTNQIFSEYDLDKDERNTSAESIDYMHILEAVGESGADDIAMSAMNEIENITYNVSTFNESVDHHEEVHPSNLSEVVGNEGIDTTLDNVIMKNKDKISNQLDTSQEYIDNKTENFDGIIVSEGHGTNIPEDAINESLTANNLQKKTENKYMKKQSGKADVAVADQNENKFMFLPFEHFIHQNKSETKRLTL